MQKRAIYLPQSTVFDFMKFRTLGTSRNPALPQFSKSMRTCFLNSALATLALFGLGVQTTQGQLFFDFNTGNGLTPNISPAVDWTGAYWQTSLTPGTGTPGAWVSGSDVNFLTDGINLLNVNSLVQVGDLAQDNFSAGTQTDIGGSSTLTLAGANVMNYSAEALRFLTGLTLNLNPTGGLQTWNAANGNIVVNSAVTGLGSGVLVKTGDGTLFLNGNNLYTGTTQLAGGITEAGSATAFGTSTILIDGGTLRYATGVTQDFSSQFGAFGSSGATINTNGNNITFATALTGPSASLTKTGAGILTLSSAATYAGGTTVSQGTLKIASGAAASALGSGQTVTVANGATLDVNGNLGNGTKYDIFVSGSGVAGTAALWNSGGTAINSSVWQSITLTGDTTIGGVQRYDVPGTLFNGGNYTLTKVGSNQVTWFPSGASTVGNIVINEGAFMAQNSVLGNVAAPYKIQVNADATFNNWSNQSTVKAVEMNGGIIATGGAGAFGGGTAVTFSLNGTVTLNTGNNRMAPGNGGVNLDHIRLGGQVVGVGGFTKNETGTLYLLGSNNTFSGDVTITNGTVQMSDGALNGTLGTTAKTLTITGGALDLFGTGQTIGALNGTAGNIQNNHLTNASTLTVGNGGADGAYAGVIRNNSGIGSTVSLIKTGAGRQILSGINTFTGTTSVSGGALQIGTGTTVTSTATSGAGNISVASSATLAGNGTVGGAAGTTTVDSGGFLSVGNTGATAAQMMTVNGALTNNGTMQFDVWTYTAGGAGTADSILFNTNSLIDLNGTLALANNSGVTNWGLGSSVKLFDWGTVAAGNRDISGMTLNYGTMGVAAGYIWDTSKLATTGSITVLADTLAGALTWDATVPAPSGPQDGTGVWTTDNHWYNTTTAANQVFANGDSVTFGANSGGAGIINVAVAGVTVKHMNFLAPGSGNYTIGGPGRITLSTDSTIRTDVNATISASLGGAGVGFTKTGLGKLTLSGNNTYTGATNLYAGTVAMENTAALGVGGSIIFNGGTLQYGRGIVMDYSSRFAALGADGATIDTNGNNLTMAGVLTGAGTFTKTGNGRLVLTGNNLAYTGQIIVDQGILALGSLNAAGTASGTLTDGLIVRNGATLDISGSVTGGPTLPNERLVVSGRGVGNLGAIMKNSGSNPSLNRVVLAGHTTFNMNARWDFDALMDAQGYSVTKIGSSDLPWEGGLGGAPDNSKNLGNIYVKQGSVNFSGDADMGYFDSLTFGNTAIVNSGASLTGYNQRSDDKRTTLRGGQLVRNGDTNAAANQVLSVTGGLRLEAGNSSIRFGTARLVYQLGTISRATAGATLDIRNAAASLNPILATTSTLNTNGIIGGYATFDSNTWAVNSTNGVNGAVTGLTAFVNTFDANANVDVLAGSSPATFDVSTLRFNTAAPVTMNLAGTNTISNGGILVTSAVGANAVTINGGTIRGATAATSANSANVGELVVHQNNTGGTVTIGSVIADNGGPTALTKTGAGTLILATTTTNSYTGNTYINGNSGGDGGTGALQVGNLQSSGDAAFDNLGSTSSQIFFNNGLLRYSNATTDATMNRTVNLLSGGGTFEIETAGRKLTLSGKITGETLAGDEGHYFGQGNLTKGGGGILEITNGTNDYTGTTVVNGGILRVTGAGKLGASIARLTVNGGALELNGTNQSVGLLGGGAAGVIRNNGAGNSTLTIGNDDATFVSSTVNWGFGDGYAGTIQDGTSGTVSLVKNGVGYQIMTGVNTYTGTTSVAGGTLQIGSGTAATSTGKTGTGLHTVFTGATLAGNGIVGGNLAVNAGGLLSVGNFGQTTAQTLALNGGLTSNGAIAFDLWTHAGSVTTVDSLKFNTADSVVAINGAMIVNNMLATASPWAVNESIKLFDWGPTSVGNRTLNTSLLDISTLGLASAGTYWDTSRLAVDGTIVVLADAFTWDATPATPGAQDGAGTWKTADVNFNNWYSTAGTNNAYTANSNVIFGTNTAAAGTVTVDAAGVAVGNMTFNPAASGYYTIAGSVPTAALTVAAGSWITTNDTSSSAGDSVIGAKISSIIAGTAPAASNAWTKSGTGRLIISGANTYTGITTVAQGILHIGGSGTSTALGSTTNGGTVINNGASVVIGDGLGNISIAESFTINGAGYLNKGVLRNQSQDNTISGSIALASASQITSRNGILTLSGVVSGAFGLAITGEDPSAIISLAGSSSNTFSGGVNVNSGILRLGKNTGTTAIAANQAVNINGTGILRLANADQISDTGVPITFNGGTSTFQLYGFNETVSGIQSTQGNGVISNGNSGNSTLTVANILDYVYGGGMENGGGTLGLTKSGAAKLTLTGIAGYTGSTTVTGGVLELAGTSGSITASNAITVSGATLRLTNATGSNSANRLVDSTKVTMAASIFDFNHAADTNNYAETIGQIELVGGHNTVQTSQAAVGGTSALTIASLARVNAATVNFSGTNLGLTAQNQVLFSTPPTTLDHGLLGAWATVGNEYAKYGPLGVTAFTAADYETTAEGAAWTFSKNVKATAGPTLTADRNINSLNLAQGSASTLNLGANTLRLESGGLLVSGAFDSAITNGELTAGTGNYNNGELIIRQNSGAASTLTISAAITNNGTNAVGLTKSGDGAVVLTGTNTFTGAVTLNEGTLRIGSATAFVAGNDLAVQAGTFDLNGNSITAGALSSFGATGIITSTAPATLTVGSGNKSSTYNGRIQGATAITKTGTGTLTLTGGSNYTGVTNVQAGKLSVGSATSLGATGAGSNTIVSSGATLEIIGEGQYDETISMGGEGVSRLGALVLADVPTLRGGADQVRVMNLTLTGNTTINTNNKRLDLDSVLNANGFAITKIGSAQTTYEGGQTTNLGNLFVKQGDFTFGGGAGALGNSASTIYVNSGATMQFFNVGALGKAITLRGGQWTRGGSLTNLPYGNEFTVTGGLKLEAGNSQLTHSATSQVVHLGTLRRDKGATFNVIYSATTNSSPFTTSTTNTNGIIGGYMTYGGTTWASSGDSGTNIAITGLSAYETSAASTDWTAMENVSLGVNASGVDTRTINSLRLTAASTVTIGTGNTLTLGTGGLLVTGTGATTITGGNLTGSSTGELIVHQNATANLTVASAIVNNGSTPTALTKSGSGTMILSGTNTYTGGTYINGAAGSATKGTLSISAISDTNAATSNLGYSTGGADNALNFNNGILAYTGPAGATTARNVNLFSGGGEFNISNSLELTGVVSLVVPELEPASGFYAGEGVLTKSGAGSLTLSGTGANTSTGNTVVSAGELVLNKTGVNAVSGNTILNGGSLRLGQSNQIVDTSLMTLNGGTFDMNGMSETIGGLSGTSSTSVVQSGAGSSTLTLNVTTDQSYSYAGSFNNANISLVKQGSGTQILTGASDYTGTTTVTAGTLQIGNGGSGVTWTGLGDVTIAADAQVVVNSAADTSLSIARIISGAGSFTKRGGGTTTIEAGAGSSFIHTGGTTVTAGRLNVNASGTIAGAGPVRVTGGVLGGYGVVNGTTTVTGTGQLQVGDSSYPYSGLSINGSLTLGRPENSTMARLVLDIGSGATFNDADLVAALNNNQSAADYFANKVVGADAFIESNYDLNLNDFSYAGSGQHDQLFINGSLTLEAGATIQVLSQANYAFQAGDVFNLGDWLGLTIVADPSGIDRAWSPSQDMILPELGDPSLVWDTSLFAQYGIVFVSVPEPGRAVMIMLGLLALLGRRRRQTV